MERVLMGPEAAFSPKAYYDGSAGAGRFIRWRVGNDLAPAEAYESTFHRPDLVQQALRETELRP